MLTAMTAEDLQRVLEQWDRKARLLEKELADIRADIEAGARLLARHAPAERSAAEPPTFHAHIPPSRLAECPTQMEAFKRIACDSGGTVRVTEASRLIHAAGLSKGKASSVASSMPRKLFESDEWEYLEPGTFRLLACDDEVEAAADEAEAVDDQADEETVVVA